MGYSKVIVATALVAALPFGVTADRAAASTVSGSLVLDLDGTISRTLDSGGDVETLTLEGAFTTTNSLVNPDKASPLGWGLTADLFWGDRVVGGQATLTESDPTPRTWNDGPSNSNLALFAEYNDPNPSEMSLFSLASFMTSIIGQSLNPDNPTPNAGNMVGGGTSTLAGIPVLWEIEDLASAFTGNYSFTINGVGDTANFFTLFDGFAGLDSELAALEDGQTFGITATVSPIPVPAALPLLAGGLGMLGLMGWHRRRRAAA